MIAAIFLQQAMGGLGNLGLLLPLMLVVMVVMTIFPQRKKQKQWAAMLEKLKPGDTVLTTGGVRGVVLNVREEIVTLRCAPDNIKLEFLKSAIASVTTTEEEKK